MKAARPTRYVGRGLSGKDTHSQQQGEEVLHLPVIVESAVASPAAAAAAASQIRKFLSKDNFSRPHVQYNSVMLIRILADNPGESFTRNLDKQFADTVKHLLRNGRDLSVSQLVHETLNALERDKAYDTNLNTLFGMWRKERGLMENAARQQLGPRRLNAPQWNGQQQIHGGFGSGESRSSSRQLPPPAELAGRIEEARTSAKLLLQLVQSTPASELLDSDLVKEFAERCTTAQRSVQGYIACDNPPPDDDTMLTLIETNEQLSLAASKHQRAVLQARRLIRPSPPSSLNHTNSSNNTPAGVPTQLYNTPAGLPAHSYDTPPLPPRHSGSSPTYGQQPTQVPAAYDNSNSNNGPVAPSSLQAASYQQRLDPSPRREEDPFADHYTTSYAPPQDPNSNDDGNSLAPYHPGFQSTPSYLHRQESSANNLTMHGAQPLITDENARDYPAHQRPRTPPSSQQQGHDVSPVADRNTVTYRY